MSSKTKIVVLHRKEVIYTIIFAVLLLILGVLLFIMFRKAPESSKQTMVQSVDAGTYEPGIYASSITLNDNTFDVTVVVDDNRIKSIQLVNLSETTAAMYPLMEPVLEELSMQIYQNQSTENLSFDEDNLYTATLLLKAIDGALEKAKIQMD